MVAPNKTEIVTDFNRDVKSMLKTLAEEFRNRGPINKRRVADECITALRKFALATKIMNDSVIDVMAPIFVKLVPLIQAKDYIQFIHTPVEKLLPGAQLDADQKTFVSLLQLAAANQAQSSLDKMCQQMEVISAHCQKYVEIS